MVSACRLSGTFAGSWTGSRGQVDLRPGLLTGWQACRVAAELAVPAGAPPQVCSLLAQTPAPLRTSLSPPVPKSPLTPPQPWLFNLQKSVANKQSRELIPETEMGGPKVLHLHLRPDGKRPRVLAQGLPDSPQGTDRSAHSRKQWKWFTGPL